MRVGDLTKHKRLMNAAEFARAYPNLRVSTFEEICEAMPLEWHRAIRAHSNIEQHATEITIGIRSTLRDRPPMPALTMSISQLYECFLAREWQMPTAFRPAGQGTMIWRTAQRTEAAFRSDVLAVYRGIRHRCLPDWMSERLYQCATSTDRAAFAMGGREVQIMPSVRRERDQLP